jgi:DNA primase
LLPKEVIEEIRLGTDLVKLIGEVVSLKRSGSNYSGKCPFHDEKSPSFSVSPSKQLYHCFGCGEGGTAITFMMKYYHLPFMDAVQKLADRLRIDLTKFQQKQNSAALDAKKKMLDVISYAAEKYHSALSTSFGIKAVEYFSKKRGLSDQMINDFKLGYAPDGWDNMLKALTRDKKPLDAATQTGILAKRQNKDGLYDVFRNRIMVPIKNQKGELVGFGGRAFGDEQPKYLNSPQSEIFDKSRLLFGLYQAEKAIREKDFVILVEGYFDQITLFQYGFQNTVATLGTAFTEYHAELLKRYTDKIVVVFDGDKAGLSASKRSMSPLLSNGFNAKIVRIPGGLDPDLFVREKGVEAFDRLIQEAKPLSYEMIDLCYTNETDLQKKAIFLEDLSDILQKTKNIYYQEVLLEEFSKKTGADKNRLMQQKLKNEFKTARPVIVKQNENYEVEMNLLRIFLEDPKHRDQIQDEKIMTLFPSGEFTVSARDWMQQISNESQVASNPSSYVDIWSHDESRSAMTKVFMEPWEDKDYLQRLTDCFEKLKKKQGTRWTAALAMAENEGREEDVQMLSRQIQELKKTQGMDQ